MKWHINEMRNKEQNVRSKAITQCKRKKTKKLAYKYISTIEVLNNDQQQQKRRKKLNIMWIDTFEIMSHTDHTGRKEIGKLAIVYQQQTYKQDWERIWCTHTHVQTSIKCTIKRTSTIWWWREEQANDQKKPSARTHSQQKTKKEEWDGGETKIEYTSKILRVGGSDNEYISMYRESNLYVYMKLAVIHILQSSFIIIIFLFFLMMLTFVVDLDFDFLSFSHSWYILCMCVCALLCTTCSASTRWPYLYTAASAIRFCDSRLLVFFMFVSAMIYLRASSSYIFWHLFLLISTTKKAPSRRIRQTARNIQY